MIRLAAWVLFAGVGVPSNASHAAVEEVEVVPGQTGVPGGRLIVGNRVEPKTFNPVTALDTVSRDITGLLSADLIHVDRGSLTPVPALAADWSVSSGGRQYTLHLRHGLSFSDGAPFTADDVLFTFKVHLDERLHSPQRDLLIMDGKPVSVTKADAYTIIFDLPRPYAAAERLFDNIAILPKHLLEKSYNEGSLASMWTLASSPSAMAGLGPFRVQSYLPGQQLVLERNPHYWRKDSRGNRLPYLDQIVFLFVGSEDAQVIRFASGQTHVITGLNPDNFAALASKGSRLYDAGPGLEYSFLLLNLNDPGPANSSIGAKQACFRDVRFRQALSSAIDRDAIVRLVYKGKAAPLWTQQSEGSGFWLNRDVPHPPRSVQRSRELLRAAGYRWNAGGALLDASDHEVRFSVLTSAGNSQRGRIATLLQDDLKQIGIGVSVVSLEFRAMLDRVFNTHEYEAAVMTLDAGDPDPSSQMNVLVSKGNTRLWNLSGDASTEWEREIDRLMRTQMTTLDPVKRKQYYDRVQELVAANLPFIPLVSPHVLVGAAPELANFRPSIMRPQALWNADLLYFRKRGLSHEFGNPSR